jgi:hypothetical protein
VRWADAAIQKLVDLVAAKSATAAIVSNIESTASWPVKADSCMLNAESFRA